MAIYHLSAKPVRRGAGRSATAAAAYRAGAEIADERTGITFDYTRKQGVEHSEIILPTAAARQDINWPRDRAALWNAAELAEHRKDSRVAREYELGDRCSQACRYCSGHCTAGCFVRRFVMPTRW